MTDERLNELACKAGFGGVSRNTHRAKLALFAEMVAADAREACAKVCELGMDTSPDAGLSVRAEGVSLSNNTTLILSGITGEQDFKVC
jgi:hypothetical protein